ncbi:MAG TPA: MOP flippase family protein [Aliidongia sp.]|uniref:MOP flippase family protein n=1 Tax=Aliidongia sp. TaxID=1914230 RepID=UPI002DDCBCC3|nr:MOP flippase family protein [Aliidongia sp.]HEV2673901.1 MOP flippase family protein [Aliidongia sp.]
MSLRVKALKSVRWTAATTISNIGARFGVTLVAAHMLPPFQLGLFAIVNLVLGFAYIFADAGVTQGIIAKQDADSDQLSSLYWFNLLFGCAVAAVSALLSPVLAYAYGQPELTGMLLVASANFAVAPIGQTFQALLQKNLRFERLGRVELGANLLSAASAAALLWAGVGIYALILSQLLTALLRSLFLWIAGRDLLQIKMRLRYDEIRHFMRFGMFQVGDRAVNYVNLRLDQFLIAALLGPQPLGYYNMAWMLIVEPVYRINPIITNVAFPVFAKKQNDPSALKRGFLLVTKLLSTTNAPLLFGFAAIAPHAVPLLLGDKWAPAIPLVELCSIIAMARTINNPVGSLVLAVGRADRSFYWTLVQFAIQVPIYAASLAWFGLVPATWVLCAINVLVVLAVYRWLIRPIIGPVFGEYVASFAPAVGLALGMGLLVRLLDHQGLLAGIPLLALELAVGAVVYGGLTLLFRRNDVGLIAGILTSRA